MFSVIKIATDETIVKSVTNRTPTFAMLRHQHALAYWVLTFATYLTTLSGLSNQLSAIDDSIQFNRDIRPILATHCLTCHGPDESTREGGLRLDHLSGATQEADSGEFAIVPGKPNQSEMIRRTSLDEEDGERMPPSGKGLNEKERSLLKRWIQSGANFDAHWAFVAPKKKALPKTKNNQWVQNSIDRFVLSRLEQEKLSPNQPADRYIIVRRVYIDLLGLPPTIEEVDDFVMDVSPDAYEKMVDRVLSSPKFGERWGQVWLDLARYADSQGYAQDSPRNIYRYRDWVIDSINANKPFDEFTVEQLAGDMLKNPRNDQLIATAFHRNTMTNSEGGTDDEEFRSAAVVDRVNTTMQVWMGMTMGCAQCHTHKYDPITHKEYFQVYAILNQTEDADRPNESPLLSELSPVRQKQKQRLEAQIAALKSEIANEKINNKNAKQRMTELPAGELKARYVRVQGLGKMFLHLAEVEVFSEEKNVALKGIASQSSTAFNGPPKLANDGNSNGDFAKNSVTHTAEEENPWWEVDLKRDITVDKVVVWNRSESQSVVDRLKKFRVILLDKNRKPIWTSTSNQPPNPSKEFTAPKHSDQLSPADRDRLIALTKEMGSGLSPKEQRINALEKELAKVSSPDISTPILRQLASGKQRVTKIHNRGNFRSQGDVVQAGTPNVFHQLKPRGETLDRLDFANWIIDSKNPMTSRVTVNRFWEHLFGIGIVQTSEDFGTQGELPSHPKLLDHLAIEFMEHDWDVKWLLKKIVSSATYRQSSKVTPQIQELDPRNRKLSHGPRFRLSAEMIRDQALFVSGSLSNKMNGPSVRPPKPKLGLRAAFGGSTDWDPSPGEDAYRRGLYTTWRRTAPYPSMTTFDAPSREFCTIRRSRTNTPLQALVTMNDPVYVEASRNLAKSVFKISDDDNDRMAYLFRKSIVRPPNRDEIKLLVNALQRAKSNLTNERATQLAGSVKLDSVDKTEFAAWVVICNVVLNLDETLSRP